VSADHEDTTPAAQQPPTGPAAAGPAGGGKAKGGGKPEPENPPMVVRDKRRVDASGKVRKPTESGSGEAEVTEPAEASATDAQPAPAAAGEPAAAEVVDAEPVEGELVNEADAAFDQAVADLIDSEQQRSGPPVQAELGALRSALDDRTRDLQRITAEYANYRKRVDRDRAVAGEQATANVLSALLPILDDLDRARGHGDLTGPFASMADALTATLGKFGLTAFGEKGDPFDPTRHEAVAHLTSPEVTEPSCIDVMRRGYLLGDRLLRPAMVAVADPA
jgi:molecular chaperone GrpE